MTTKPASLLGFCVHNAAQVPVTLEFYRPQSIHLTFAYFIQVIHRLTNQLAPPQGENMRHIRQARVVALALTLVVVQYQVAYTHAA